MTCTDTACRLDGDITVANAAWIQDELKPKIANGLQLLDFTGVTQVDSSVLALIMSCQREAAQFQRRLRLTGISGNITTLADLYGVDSFLQA
mgnify:CR=1 FL=1